MKKILNIIKDILVIGLLILGAWVMGYIMTNNVCSSDMAPLYSFMCDK